MDDPQDVDIFRDLIDIGGERPDLEQLADGVDDRPARAFLIRYGAGAADRQRAYQADDFLLGIGEAIEQLRHVVLDDGLSFDGEKLHQLDIVGAVGPDEAEIAEVARFVIGNARQAEGHGAILRRREGRGIEQLQPDTPVREARVSLEQLLDPDEMLRVRRVALSHDLGEEQAQHDRLVDALYDLLRALGHREQLAFGQIELKRLQRHVGQDVDGKQQGERQPQADGGPLRFGQGAQSMNHRSAQLARFRSTMTTFANSQNAISETKKIISRASIKPCVSALKCVRKLSEATVETSHSGAQPRKKFSTRSRPLIVNRKQAVAAMTKAMTWFFVNADMQEPIARKDPAMRKLAK